MAGSRLVGTSSAERTLDQRDLSSMRPARENAPRPRKPSVLREVTNGIVCFCGERFGEADALDFMLHLRAEYGEDLAVLERQRKHKREWMREYAKQKADDPEWQERKRALAREAARRRMADPEYRARQRAQERARYKRGGAVVRARKNAQRRARWADDPEFRERIKAKNRDRYTRQKAEQT